MKVLGVDPSSTVTGLAVAVDDAPIWSDVFRTDPKKTVDTNLWAFISHLGTLWQMHGTFDLVVVEKVSVQWNVNTIRKIAYFEAASMIKAAAEGAKVQQVQATKARRLVLGKGTLSKEACYDLLMSDESTKSGWFWQRPKNAKSDGGMDETDAVVLALAGPAL